PDMMMGNRKSGLCGTWADELKPLQQEEDALVKQLVALHASDLTSRLLLDSAERHSIQGLLIDHQPVTSLALGKPLVVTASVNSFDPMQSIRVRFRSVNQRLDYDSLEMMPTANAREYQATIPAEKIDPKWNFMYYIEGIDKSGDGARSPD